MSNPLVLDYDPTGSSPANRISGELHLLSTSTGRAVALNYGGFYTNSLVIRDPVTNTLLTPLVDYVVAGPYDNITAQTGLEAACVISITRADWKKEWEFSYSAVGGDYSTNVEAVRDVIAVNQTELNAVRWGDVINKPVGFETGVHLIDVRHELFGWEGLIRAVDRVADRMAALSPAEASIILSSLHTSMSALGQSLNASISNLQQQINGINVPDVSGFLSGSFATLSDLNAATETNKALAAVNVPALVKRTHMARAVSETNASYLDNMPHPCVTGTFNLRHGNADASVPNVSLPWYVEAKYSIVDLNNTSLRQGYQTATCLSTAAAYYGLTVFRTMPATGAPGQWRKIAGTQ